MKRSTKIFLGIIIFILLSIGSGFYWLVNGWRKYLSEEELLSYVEEVKKQPALKDEFKDLYYGLHPEQKEATLTYELIERMVSEFSNKNRGRIKGNCSCDDIIHYDWRFVSRTSRNNDRDVFKRVKLGYGLEKFLSNEECINYLLRLKYQEIKNVKQGFSFEGKNFDDLNRNEIIDFFIAEKATVYYSPRINPERYSEGKRIIEQRIKENNL